MQILRKLTIKTCGDFTIAKIKRLVKDVDDGVTVDLIKIAGESTNASTGETDKGSFTRLIGSFVGTDLTTGELFQSGVCILPEFIGAQLGAAILGSNSPVQFAFKIGAKRADNSVTGYQFAITPIGQVTQTDVQKRLLALAGIESKPHALPLPEAPDAPVVKADAANPKGKGK